ncbi:AAA family ATPase [Thioalkalivibrio sp. HK1]|uniref:AAA family ATPase n=1 Tax=Thioalkalivibrio sp. HK1 TaxID=1469245 RepID=UPI00047150A6|nr:AAA family ATPase [Thioalkalivibrio sp. HK1]
MLNRIGIKGYKSLRDVDVRLQPLTVLFGPNAAGKSNFLDALRLLSMVAIGPTIRHAFYPPYRGKVLESFSYPREGLKGVRNQESASFSIEADFTLSDFVVDATNKQIRDMTQPSELDKPRDAKKVQNIVEKRDLRYRIEVEVLPNSARLQLADERLVALDAEGKPLGGRGDFKNTFIFTRKKSNDGRLIVTKEEPNTMMVKSIRFDQSALSQPHYPPLYPYLTAARQEIASWNFFHFEPLERMRTPDPLKPAWNIGAMGENLPAYLYTLKGQSPRHFGAIERSLKFLLPEVEGIEVYLDNHGDVELNLVKDGVSISNRILSEGTLRMLALLAIGGAEQPPSLVGLEEPENGIHPSRIQLVADLLKTRAIFTERSQYIIATHSPIFVDCVPKKSLFVVTKGDEGTRIEPYSAFGSLGRWFSDDLPSVDRDDNVDEDDSESLRVSERILRGDFNG